MVCRRGQTEPARRGGPARPGGGFSRHSPVLSGAEGPRITRHCFFLIATNNDTEIRATPFPTIKLAFLIATESPLFEGKEKVVKGHCNRRREARP